MKGSSRHVWCGQAQGYLSSWALHQSWCHCVLVVSCPGDPEHRSSGCSCFLSLWRGQWVRLARGHTSLLGSQIPEASKGSLDELKIRTVEATQVHREPDSVGVLHDWEPCPGFCPAEQ